MTRMTPLRRMILQFSQSFLTDALTFMFLNSICFRKNSPLRQVEGRQLQFYFLSGSCAKRRSRSTGHKSEKPMPICKLDLVRSVRNGQFPLQVRVVLLQVREGVISLVG